MRTRTASLAEAEVGNVAPLRCAALANEWIAERETGRVPGMSYLRAIWVVIALFGTYRRWRGRKQPIPAPYERP